MNTADAAGDGERSSLAVLFTTNHPALCRFAEGLLGCPGESQEVVSEVFLRLLQRGDGCSARVNPRGYLFAAVRNAARDRLRGRRRAARVMAVAAAMDSPPGMAPPAPRQDDELCARELAAVVRRTLRSLPERPAQAFRLQHEGGLPHHEIAAVMGISVSTVEKHVMRARRELRRALAASAG
jgi:RNA polymerase sigma factor (sigma-70 family)